MTFLRIAVFIFLMGSLGSCGKKASLDPVEPDHYPRTYPKV